MYARPQIANALSLLWLASLGLGLANMLINPNTRNIEIGLAFSALALIARWYKGEWRPTGTRGLGILGLFVVLVGLLFYDDPYFVYVLAAPLILVFGLKWLAFGRDNRALTISTALLAALVCAKVWHWLFWQFGIHAGQGGGNFATLSGVGHNAQLFCVGVLDLFNANIFGQPVFSVHSLSLELNLLILASTLLSPFLLFSRWVRQDIWRVFLVLQPAFIATAFIAGSMVVDTQSGRYLVMLPFCEALILAVVLAGPIAHRLRLVVGGALVLAAVLNVASTVQVYLNRGDSPNAENQRVAQVVKEHHLTKGYASFWNAGINQYYADNKVLFIQSGCSPKAGVRPYRWLLNEQVLSRSASDSFYLLDPTATRCTEPDLERFFGQPRQVIQLGGQKQLLLYGYDISTHLRPEGR